MEAQPEAWEAKNPRVLIAFTQAHWYMQAEIIRLVLHWALKRVYCEGEAVHKSRSLLISPQRNLIYLKDNVGMFKIKETLEKQNSSS